MLKQLFVFVFGDVTQNSNSNSINNYTKKYNNTKKIMYLDTNYLDTYNNKGFYWGKTE